MSSQSDGLFAGQYRILEKLGSDAFGSYYDTEHNELGARYALKTIPFLSGVTLSETAMEGFLAGCRQLTELRHPNVARIFGINFDDASQRLYFVSDLVLAPDGEAHVLSDLEGIDEYMVYTWAKDLIGALDHIHAHGLVHGNIRMENVFINADYHAVLAGLGMTSLFEEPICSCVALPKEMSPHYAAPEVRASGSLSAASDVYAVGAILARLLTGSWLDEDPLALLRLPKGEYDWTSLLQQMLAPVESRPETVGPLLAKLKVAQAKAPSRPAAGRKPVMSVKKKRAAKAKAANMAMRTSSYRTDGGESSVGTIVFRLLILAAIAAGAVYAAFHFVRQKRDEAMADRATRPSSAPAAAVSEASPSDAPAPAASAAAPASAPAPAPKRSAPSEEASLDDLFED